MLRNLPLTSLSTGAPGRLHVRRWLQGVPVALNVEKVLFGALHGTCGESTEPRASFAEAVDYSLVAIEVVALGIWMCARSLAWVRKKVTLTPTRATAHSSYVPPPTPERSGTIRLRLLVGQVDICPP